MNASGLLSWQPDHGDQLLKCLRLRGSALDGSDTGTGKTAVALAVARELGCVPFVVGPKNSKVTWEHMSKHMDVPVEWINYEMVRGRRTLKGGYEIDALSISENRLDCIKNPRWVTGYRAGKTMFKQPMTLGESFDLLQTFVGSQAVVFGQCGEFEREDTITVLQERTAESDWVEECKYGSGSYVKWKSNYEMMIFDEVHRCGGSTTLNSKLLIAARRQARYVLCLSATASDDPRQMKALGFALGLHGLSDKKNSYRSWLFRHGCSEIEGMGMVFANSSDHQRSVFSGLHEEIFPEHGARMRKHLIPDFPRTQIITELIEDEDGKAKKLVDEQAGAVVEETWVQCAQRLELLMVPHIVDLVQDRCADTPCAIFVNYTKTVDKLMHELSHLGGIGRIDGTPLGVSCRDVDAENFREDRLAAIVCNTGAASESLSLHGKKERTAIIAPCASGRRLKQIFGRVDRAGGANSVQYLLAFAGTQQEEICDRVVTRVDNIDTFNDGDLRPRLTSFRA